MGGERGWEVRGMGGERGWEVRGDGRRGRIMAKLAICSYKN